MLFTKSLITIAVSATLFGGQIASAQDSEIRSMRIRHADLNLNQNEDAQVLARRLKSAAKRVCENSGSTLAERLAEQQCVRESLARAEADVATLRMRQQFAGRP